MSTDVHETKSEAQELEPAELASTVIPQGAAKPKRRRWPYVVGLLLVVAAGFGVKSLLNQKVVVKMGPLLTHTVERGDLMVTIVEQGTLESNENLEIKCKVRGENTIIWVIENGSSVEEGQELLRLDTLAIEDAINERSKYALWSLSGAEQAAANARRAEIAIKEYLEGRFVTQLKNLEKDLAIAESNLRTEENMRKHTLRMFERGYVSELDLEERDFAVTQAQLNVEAKTSEIDILEKFNKQEELERLKGDLKAAQANQSSLEERAKMDGTRRDLAVEELSQCIVKAPKAGMVIYPSAKAWERQPDIEEGATVHRNQTLLLMPDLDNMQVKVGIHESMVERVEKGLKARIGIPGHDMEGEVSSVASVARPAGWWTGNIVKYDTIVSLPQIPGLRPGMSAGVEIILAEHFDVIKVPVAAVLETVDGDLCWVQTEEGTEKRLLEVGDSNDVFVVAMSGVEAGEKVVLNPRGSIEEARQLELRSAQGNDSKEESSNQENADKESSSEGKKAAGSAKAGKKQANGEKVSATSSEVERPPSPSSAAKGTLGKNVDGKQAVSEN